MSNTFTKKGFRGFTLIELLVVIAIIGLLSTIIAAPIQNARKKARDAKKIAEIKAIELALDQYAEANRGSYPSSLADLAPVYMPILPTFAVSSGSSAAAPKDQFAYTIYTVSGSGISTVTFGYHLGVHLENYSQALDSDRDCKDASLGATLPSGICVFFNATTGGAITATYNNSAVTGAIVSVVPSGSGVSGTDFDGTDTGTSTCGGVADCVYDLTGQQ